MVPSSSGIVTRYKPNGSLYATFGMGGLIFNDFFGSANSVATQPKGKIVVTGIAIGLGNVDFSVTRYNYRSERLRAQPQDISQD